MSGVPADSAHSASSVLRTASPLGLPKSHSPVLDEITALIKPCYAPVRQSIHCTFRPIRERGVPIDDHSFRLVWGSNGEPSSPSGQLSVRASSLRLPGSSAEYVTGSFCRTPPSNEAARQPIQIPDLQLPPVCAQDALTRRWEISTPVARKAVFGAGTITYAGSSDESPESPESPESARKRAKRSLSPFSRAEVSK